MTSIGLIPQDLKFGGEPTRLVIGDRNVIREFVTIHRGTAGGGGLTEHRRPQPVHGLHAHRARLPRRQRDDLRQRRDARRARAPSRTTPPSAPSRACTSSAASASTPSSAATRSSRRTRCRSRRPSATARGSTASTRSAWSAASSRRTRSRSCAAPTASCCTRTPAAPLAQIEQDPSLQLRRGALRGGVHPLVAARRRPAPAEPPAGRSRRGLADWLKSPKLRSRYSRRRSEPFNSCRMSSTLRTFADFGVCTTDGRP